VLWRIWINKTPYHPDKHNGARPFVNIVAAQG
jgi:hypothetical protein